MENFKKHNPFLEVVKNKKDSFIFENDSAVSFSDIFPKSPTHILVIPKKEYLDFYKFQQEASEKEKSDFWNCVSETIKKLNIYSKGFRIISNCGDFGQQEVFHFHVHIQSN